MLERKPTRRSVEKLLDTAVTLAGPEGYSSFQEDKGTRIEVRSKTTELYSHVTVSVNQQHGDVFPTTIVHAVGVDNAAFVDHSLYTGELSEEGVTLTQRELTNQELRKLVRRLGKLPQKDAEFKADDKEESLDQKEIMLGVQRAFTLADASGYLLRSRLEDDDNPEDLVEARFENDAGDHIYILDETLPDRRALHVVINPADTQIPHTYTLNIHSGEFTVTDLDDKPGEYVAGSIADQERVCELLKTLDISNVRPFN